MKEEMATSAADPVLGCLVAGECNATQRSDPATASSALVMSRWITWI